MTFASFSNDPPLRTHQLANVCRVDSYHDLGIEQVDECAEIALTRRQKEGVHHVALTREIGVWNG